MLLARSLPNITTIVASPSRAGPPVIDTGTGMRVTRMPPIAPTDRRGDVGACRKEVHLADVELLLDAGGVGRIGHVETERGRARRVSSAAAPVTPDALATITTAPSVISGIVVVVVGGIVVVVVVVDVVVVLVVVGGMVVVVVVVVDDGGRRRGRRGDRGPNVHPASSTKSAAINDILWPIRSSCRVVAAQTSRAPTDPRRP